MSLIAINVLGTEIETKKTTPSVNVDDKVNAILNDPEYLSPYDDLAFEMYVDTEVAKIIREMEVKKHAAVISTYLSYRADFPCMKRVFQVRDSNTRGS